jgi:hypothetical protein
MGAHTGKWSAKKQFGRSSKVWLLHKKTYFTKRTHKKHFWVVKRVIGRSRSEMGALVRFGFYTKFFFTKRTHKKHFWVVKRLIGRSRSEMGARVTIGFVSKKFFNQSSAHKTPKCRIRDYLGARAKLWAHKRVFVSPVKTFLPQESAQ